MFINYMQNHIFISSILAMFMQIPIGRFDVNFYTSCPNLIMNFYLSHRKIWSRIYFIPQPSLNHLNQLTIDSPQRQSIKQLESPYKMKQFLFHLIEFKSFKH